MLLYVSNFVILLFEGFDFHWVLALEELVKALSLVSAYVRFVAPLRESIGPGGALRMVIGLILLGIWSVGARRLDHTIL